MSVTHQKLEGEIRRLMADMYGLRITSMTPLEGYDDVNYHLLTRVSHTNPNIQTVSSSGYCLKIINEGDSKQPEKIAAVQAVMEHLSRAGIPTQDLVRTVQGHKYSHLVMNGSNGTHEERLVCVRTFLPGQTMKCFTLEPRRQYQLGAFVAEVTQKLRNFHHPFFDTQDFSWSLENLPRVAEKLSFVPDKARRAIVEDVLTTFDAQVVPRMPELGRGQIHADIHERNIIIRDGQMKTRNVNNNQTDSGLLHISGLIDFQDTHYSYLIHELAITTAHLMLSSRTEEEALEMAEHTLAGYRSVRHLNEAELVVLPLCTAGRLCQYLVYGEYYLHLDPSNIYVLGDADQGWAVLKKLWKTFQQQFHRR